MAELTPQERLQPSLLDRLTDNEPNKRRESRDQRVLSVRRLKEGVLRDLRWLLNCGQLSQIENLSAFPEVRNSVLNFGAPDLSGSHLSSTKLRDLETALLQAITFFEPRLLPHTVKLRVIANDGSWDQKALRFEIEGMLWSQPLPQQLFLLTDIDLETGEVTTLESK